MSSQREGLYPQRQNIGKEQRQSMRGRVEASAPCFSLLPASPFSVPPKLYRSRGLGGAKLGEQEFFCSFLWLEIQARSREGISQNTHLIYPTACLLAPSLSQALSHVSNSVLLP